MMRSVFVSGPYTAETREERDENIYRAECVAQRLARDGYAVFCPHTQTLGWEDKTDLPYRYYLTNSLYWLAKCDEVVMLPGWQESHGAQIEHTVAGALGLEITYLSEVF